MMLPNGWKKSKIGETCSLLSGQDFPPNLYGNEEKGLPYITGASNFAGNHIVLNRWTEHPKNIAKKGDILLVCKGSGFGNTAIADFEKAHIARQVMALQKLNGVDRDFLYQVISMNVRNIKQKGCGLIPGIDRKTVLNIEYLLPPIEEQKKIAATLSVWDSAIEKMEKLIDAKEDQKKSLIWKLIENTDAIRKEKIKIDDLFDEVCEKNHPDADVLTIIQGTGTLLREKSGRDIVYDKKSLSNYKFVKKGDFIIHLRSFEGGLEVANQDGIVSPAYIILRPKIEVSTDYLYALFHTNRFINYTISPAVEGARDGRSVKYDALKKQFINLPTFSEQKYIAKIITTAEKEHSLLKQQLENYKKQKQGLMQKLLTGQWRVK